MLYNFVNPADIKINLESTEKEECLAELLEVIAARQPHLNRKEALDALILREDKSSTAVFPSIAIPHAVCSSITNPAIAIGISKTGIDFDPKANIIFEVLMEKNNAEFHLKILKDIVQLLGNKTFINKVLNAKSAQEICDIIYDIETDIA